MRRRSPPTSLRIHSQHISMKVTRVFVGREVRHRPKDFGELHHANGNTTSRLGSLPYLELLPMTAHAVSADVHHETSN